MENILYKLRSTIKRDLINIIGTTIAFNALDRWWQESEKQSKVILYYLFIFDFDI